MLLFTAECLRDSNQNIKLEKKSELPVLQLGYVTAKPS